MLRLVENMLLDGYAENTWEYRLLTISDSAEQSRIKKDVLDNFMVVIVLHNAENGRFGNMLVDY